MTSAEEVLRELFVPGAVGKRAELSFRSPTGFVGLRNLLCFQKGKKQQVLRGACPERKTKADSSLRSE